MKGAWDWLNSAFSGFEGLKPEDAHHGFSGLDTLNGTISSISNSSNSNSLIVQNTFNGLVEESAADYIVGAVNDRLRKEKLLKGV